MFYNEKKFRVRNNSRFVNTHVAEKYISHQINHWTEMEPHRHGPLTLYLKIMWNIMQRLSIVTNMACKVCIWSEMSQGSNSISTLVQHVYLDVGIVIKVWRDSVNTVLHLTHTDMFVGINKCGYRLTAHHRESFS